MKCHPKGCLAGAKSINMPTAVFGFFGADVNHHKYI
jgi:hypothetical protein